MGRAPLHYLGGCRGFLKTLYARRGSAWISVGRVCTACQAFQPDQRSAEWDRSRRRGCGVLGSAQLIRGLKTGG